MTGARAVTVTALILAVAILPGPWGGDNIPAPGTAVPGVPGDPARGAKVFRRLECTRCHTEPRGGRGIDVPPSLNIAGSRAPATWLASWIHDPEPLRYAAEGVRPRIRMPAVRATPAETQDLVAYLATLRDTTAFGPGESVVLGDSARIAEGELLFHQYQCAGCHQLGGQGGQVGPALDEVGRRRRPDYVVALLREPNAIVPGTAMKDFDLWDDEASALASYLMSLRGSRKVPEDVTGPGAGKANP